MLPFVDAAIKEYLLFRGFTSAFDVFNREAQEVRTRVIASAATPPSLSLSGTLHARG